jgi:hypothetical protein
VIPALRRWLRFLLAVYGPHRPRPLFDVWEARDRQRLAALSAAHHPINTPARRGRPLNEEGFQ